MRTIISLLSLVIAATLAACSMPQGDASFEASVVTESGVAVAQSRDPRVVHWLDIPYAQPPEGPLRWRAPQALNPSERTLPVGDGSVMCPQMPSNTAQVEGDGPVGEEDCLYLDIVAPRDFQRASYPVMVWIHGGGNTAGRKGTFDFAELAARENVIVVTVNYRLGPLGWMTHPALQGTAQGLDRSSNFGTLDIIAALQWTQRNIAGFGGDNQNVTVFGESAGGHNIYSLLASPLTNGLFHRAIVQSGYTTSVTPREAINRDREFSQIDRGAWELFESLAVDPATASAEDLRQLNAGDIVAAYESIPKDHIAPLTTADDIVIPAAGLLSALADPQLAKNIPVIAGSNRDELTLWLARNPYFMATHPVLFGLLPDRYELRRPELYDYWVDMRSRAWKARGVDQVLSALNGAGYDQLYGYRFDWDEQEDTWFIAFSEVLGASHAAEVAFVMGSPFFGPVGEYMYPETESAATMTDIMMSAWGRFAKQGSPGDVQGKAWPPFMAAAPHTMVLDVSEAAGVSGESDSLDSLLQEVAASTLLSDAEACILVWEMLTNIGAPQYDAYRRWNNGACKAFDARSQRAALVRDAASASS